MTDGLPHVYSGKVRDIYDAGDGRLLLVSSDRLSAFDVVMAEPIPDKGRVLTAMSAFWFEHFDGVVGSHLISTELADLPAEAQKPEWEGRVMLCRRAEMLPIECIVRGYLAGSAWKEYSRNGTMHGEELPGGLLESAELPEPVYTPSTKADMLPIECIVRGYITGSAWKEYKASGTMHGSRLPDDLLESSQLPEPVFTPSTKADEGHDENISFEAAANLVGNEMAEQVREVAVELYSRGRDWAAERGIIIADTKFELGLIDGELVLADEVLTPDSSRFWPADRWEPGTTPPSFDKQPVRDLLDDLDWDKQPPPPPLSADVVTATRSRYVEAYERITGRALADWHG